jgi:hypothetical protein
MTKKHFEALADALHYVKPSNPVVRPTDHKIALACMTTMWVDAVDAIASVCGQENPRFDHSRFYHRADHGHNLTAKCGKKGSLCIA